MIHAKPPLIGGSQTPKLAIDTQYVTGKYDGYGKKDLYEDDNSIKETIKIRLKLLQQSLTPSPEEMGALLQALVRTKPQTIKIKGLAFLINQIQTYDDLRRKFLLAHSDKDLPTVRITIDLIEDVETTIRATRLINIKPGKTITSRKKTYELGREIGKGVNGRVFLVKEKESGTISAVKIVARTTEKTVMMKQKGGKPTEKLVIKHHDNDMVDEININKELHHKHVVELRNYWKNKEFIFVHMEYVDCDELSKVMHLLSDPPKNKNRPANNFSTTTFAQQANYPFGYEDRKLPPLKKRDVMQKFVISVNPFKPENLE